MPVTQRWVHSGLILVVGILSLSLTVLILGASRAPVNNLGLVGSQAPVFALKDAAGDWVNLKDLHGKTVVLIACPTAANGLGKQSKALQQLVDTFGGDPDLKFVGLQFDPQSGLLSEQHAGPGAVEAALPTVQTVSDIDRSVATAYRVGPTPTLFVIDGDGVIRSRVALDSDDALISTSETITSLRKAPLTIPMTATDRKAF